MKGNQKYDNGRQLHIEEYLQENKLETKGNVEVPSIFAVSSKEEIDTKTVTNELLEKILSKDNLNMAFKRVKANKGASGIDDMKVDELLQYLKENGEQIKENIRKGKYNPKAVRRVEIPKADGSKRKLGIPTVVDRVIQQAIAQQLSIIYEPIFSENSYGFRPNRSCHDAILKVKEIMNNGYKWVVDLDLEKFFDTVNQDLLISIIRRTINEDKVVSLIRKYLQAGVLVNGVFEKTEKGTPQGGNISPILSNIMLNELDKELESRGHRFVRYADDCMIFCKSRKSAERTLNNIVPYIEGKLFLKVNRTKTCVAHISKVKYLGYSFYRYKGTCRFRVHPKSVIKMKNKIRELTDRHNGWGNEYRALKLTQFIRGWVNYFGMADMKILLQSNDKWLRHRIRAIYWKQWKKVKTKFKELKKLGVEEERAWICANMRNGNWFCSGYITLQGAFNNKKLRELGYPTFTEFYLKICEN